METTNALNAGARHRRMELERAICGEGCSVKHRNPGWQRGSWLSYRHVRPPEPGKPQAFRATHAFVPSSLTGLLRAPHLPFSPWPLYFPSFTLPPPIAHLTLPAQSVLAHRPLISKCSPFLCQAIHRVTRCPALVGEFLHRHSNRT